MFLHMALDESVMQEIKHIVLDWLYNWSWYKQTIPNAVVHECAHAMTLLSLAQLRHVADL